MLWFLGRCENSEQKKMNMQVPAVKLQKGDLWKAGSQVDSRTRLLAPGVAFVGEVPAFCSQVQHGSKEWEGESFIVRIYNFGRRCSFERNFLPRRKYLKNKLNENKVAYIHANQA